MTTQLQPTDNGAESLAIINSNTTELDTGQNNNSYL